MSTQSTNSQFCSVFFELLGERYFKECDEAIHFAEAKTLEAFYAKKVTDCPIYDDCFQGRGLDYNKTTVAFANVVVSRSTVTVTPKVGWLTANVPVAHEHRMLGTNNSLTTHRFIQIMKCAGLNSSTTKPNVPFISNDEWVKCMFNCE